MVNSIRYSKEIRKEVYVKAKERHPNRCSREITKWNLKKHVLLNPIRDKEFQDIETALS